jgi:hypothetical protein
MENLVWGVQGARATPRAWLGSGLDGGLD